MHNFLLPGDGTIGGKKRRKKKNGTHKRKQGEQHAHVWLNILSYFNFFLKESEANKQMHRNLHISILKGYIIPLLGIGDSTSVKMLANHLFISVCQKFAV